MKASKLRRIAWHINHCQDYLTFKGEAPDFSWPVTKGSIPWYLWYSKAFRETYIVKPTIRKRLKWTRRMLKRDSHALPYYTLDRLNDQWEMDDDIERQKKYWDNVNLPYKEYMPTKFKDSYPDTKFER